MTTTTPAREDLPTGAKPTAAIVGPGNIGTDLLVKLQRSDDIDVRYMIGVDPASDGLARAREAWASRPAPAAWTGCWRRTSCPTWSSRRRRRRRTWRMRARYAEAGITAIDLTPAAVGPFVCPAVNADVHAGRAEHQHDHLRWPGDDPDRARRLAGDPVPYAEIVASIASRSAGPGTRANIDEFTETTAHAIEAVGGAERGKAIIILNPVSPPMIMRDTVFCAIGPDADRDAITESIHRMVAEVQQYVPGYQLRSDPQFDDPNPAWHGNAPGRGVPRGERQRRLPAAVGRKSRHHDRRRGARRRTDRHEPRRRHR